MFSYEFLNFFLPLNPFQMDLALDSVCWMEVRVTLKLSHFHKDKSNTQKDCEPIKTQCSQRYALNFGRESIVFYWGLNWLIEIQMSFYLQVCYNISRMPERTSQRSTLTGFKLYIMTRESLRQTVALSHSFVCSSDFIRGQIWVWLCVFGHMPLVGTLQGCHEVQICRQMTFWPQQRV